MDLDFGVLTEGRIDYDPVTQGYVLITDNDDGTTSRLCLTELMERYRGEEVRLILVPVSTIQAVAEQVGDNPDMSALPLAGSGIPT